MFGVFVAISSRSDIATQAHRSCQRLLGLLSYNSTGFNSIKTDWIRDLCKTTNVDYFSIQEHFISSKSAYKYCKEQFPLYCPYVIPAVRSENQDSGRAKGGIAQFMKKSLNIKVQRIVTKSTRLQAQILTFLILITMMTVFGRGI